MLEYQLVLIVGTSKRGNKYTALAIEDSTTKRKFLTFDTNAINLLCSYTDLAEAEKVGYKYLGDLLLK